jgi:hypothetical protein
VGRVLGPDADGPAGFGQADGGGQATDTSANHKGLVAHEGRVLRNGQQSAPTDADGLSRAATLVGPAARDGRHG